jgi:hypothetical protein
MPTTKTKITPTRTFAAKGVKDEIGRRRKPKADRSPSKSWVFGGMDNAMLQALLDGEVVKVEFKNRVEFVGLRD